MAAAASSRSAAGVVWSLRALTQGARAWCASPGTACGQERCGSERGAGGGIGVSILGDGGSDWSQLADLLLDALMTPSHRRNGRLAPGVASELCSAAAACLHVCGHAGVGQHGRGSSTALSPQRSDALLTSLAVIVGSDQGEGGASKASGGPSAAAMLQLDAVGATAMSALLQEALPAASQLQSLPSHASSLDACPRTCLLNACVSASCSIAAAGGGGPEGNRAAGAALRALAACVCSLLGLQQPLCPTPAPLLSSGTSPASHQGMPRARRSQSTHVGALPNPMCAADPVAAAHSRLLDGGALPTARAYGCGAYGASLLAAVRMRGTVGRALSADHSACLGCDDAGTQPWWASGDVASLCTLACMDALRHGSQRMHEEAQALKARGQVHQQRPSERAVPVADAASSFSDISQGGSAMAAAANPLASNCTSFFKGIADALAELLLAFQHGDPSPGDLLALLGMASLGVAVATSALHSAAAVSAATGEAPDLPAGFVSVAEAAAAVFGKLEKVFTTSWSDWP